MLFCPLCGESGLSVQVTWWESQGFAENQRCVQDLSFLPWRRGEASSLQLLVTELYWKWFHTKLFFTFRAQHIICVFLLVIASKPVCHQFGCKLHTEPSDLDGIRSTWSSPFNNFKFFSETLNFIFGKSTSPVFLHTQLSAGGDSDDVELDVSLNRITPPASVASDRRAAVSARRTGSRWPAPCLGFQSCRIEWLWMGDLPLWGGSTESSAVRVACGNVSDLLLYFSIFPSFLCWAVISLNPLVVCSHSTSFLHSFPFS